MTTEDDLADAERDRLLAKYATMIKQLGPDITVARIERAIAADPELARVMSALDIAASASIARALILQLVRADPAHADYIFKALLLKDSGLISLAELRTLQPEQIRDRLIELVENDAPLALTICERIGLMP